jgi:hypothetical protein
MEWKVERRARAWRGAEAMQRYDLAPERIKMIDGKLLWDDEARLNLLGLLLENLGADAAVRIGDPSVWREAVAELGPPSGFGS